MRRGVHVFLTIFLLFFPSIVMAGPNDVWRSCCSSGCDYSPSCNPISFSFGTYYCCNNGWSTSLCSECGGTPTTTTTTQPTTTTTTTLPACSCSQCNFYSSSNCDNSCNEFQNCMQVTCSLSGCSANPNCYKCEWMLCNQIRPKVYILTPVVRSGGEMKVSVVFECRQWTNNAKNLTLSLKINNLDWNECFVNEKGLMTDFGWNNTCDNMKSGNCGRHNKWSCDSHSICKHSDYNLWVKSNFSRYYVNITFVCNLPSLSSGTHTLSVVAKIYESEIVSRPSRISFYVISGNEGKIVEILLLPIKILKRILLL